MCAAALLMEELPEVLLEVIFLANQIFFFEIAAYHLANLPKG
jgi:hypothetical protein